MHSKEMTKYYEPTTSSRRASVSFGPKIIEYSSSFSSQNASVWKCDT